MICVSLNGGAYRFKRDGKLNAPRNAATIFSPLINMKKTLKQFIFNEMDKKGYVLDQELADFCGKEPNFYTAEQYKQEWQRLQWCLTSHNFHEDDTTEIHKGYRCYLVRNKEIKDIDENRWLKIPKIYFDYLKNKGRKNKNNFN